MRSMKEHSEMSAMLIRTTVEKTRPPFLKALPRKRMPVPTKPLSSCGRVSLEQQARRP
jgi:hypothetical protein